MNPERRVALSPGLRLQWEEAQRAWVLLFPEGMVTLNESAGAVLRLCDGRSIAALVDELGRDFPDADLAEDVREFLATAQEEGWIRVD